MPGIWYAELTTPQRRAYNRTLASSHEAHTVVELWYRNRDLAARIDLPVDGQVDIDGVSRTCTCVIADPDGHLKLDTNLIFLDRVLRVERWVFVPEITDNGDWVKVPMFTGPVVKADENGGEISLEAQGFDLWLKGAQRHVTRYNKGGMVTHAIQNLLRLGGVPLANMTIPNRRDKLPSQFQIGPQTEGGIWEAVQYLAESINCDLYADGRGEFVLRHRPSPPAWNFTGGDDGTMIGRPQRSTLIAGGGQDAIINDVVVFGKAKPKKPPKDPPEDWKPPALPVIRGEAIAKAGSRFAPKSLGFPDDPDGLFLKDVVTMEHVRLNSTARKIAKLRLDRGLKTTAQVTFATAPIPHLDPYDRIYVDADGYAGTSYLTKASIPFLFTESTPMTVGYNKLVHNRPPGWHKP